MTVKKTPANIAVGNWVVTQGENKYFTVKTVNTKTKKRRIPYENIVYLGDGMTDVPCMVLVKQNGGKSIAIHQKKDTKNMANLTREGRVNFACLADYTEGSDLEKTMKLIIDRIAIHNELQAKEEALIRKVSKEAKQLG